MEGEGPGVGGWYCSREDPRGEGEGWIQKIVKPELICDEKCLILIYTGVVVVGRPGGTEAGRRSDSQQEISEQETESSATYSKVKKQAIGCEPHGC